MSNDDKPERINEFFIKYKPKKNKEKKLRIFGQILFNNNRDKFEIIYNDKRFELKEFFEEIDDNYNHKKEIVLQLRKIKETKNISYMFHNCETLLSFPELSEINIFEENDIINTTSETDSLSSQNEDLENDAQENSGLAAELNQEPIPCTFTKINKMITTNLTEINIIFPKTNLFSSLVNLNVINMSHMFDGCISLKSLPDISHWNTSKATNMSYMFNECKSLLILPDISKWDISNVKNIKNMFARCSSLISLPDISKWNTENITNISYLFIGCNSLNSIPDISKWIIKNVNEMHYMFFGCNSLVSLPDISKWKISDNIYISHLFYRCGSLSFLPNITKWNNNSNLTDLFNGCFNSLNIPLNY